MSAAEAIAKARAIAAKLALGSSNVPSSDLGKRKTRDEDGGSYYQPQTSGVGLGAVVKKKVYIPTRQYPDINFLGLLIGPRGRTQKELESRTGAKILIRGRGSQKDGFYAGPTGNPDDDDEQHVSIEGTEEAVAKAMAEVEDVLFNPEKAQQIKNEQLRALNDEKSALQKYTGGVGSVSTGEDGEARLELQVPNHLVGYLIGKSGENIQKLQRETGVHCQIAKESEMRPGDTMRSVILTGTDGGVREAKRMVDDLVSEKIHGGMGRDEKKPKDNQEQLDKYSTILKVAVPNDKVGLIIGRQGATVKGIQDNTMTFIHIPVGPDEDNPAVRTLSIAGNTRESVEAAQMEIAMQLQQNLQQRSNELAMAAAASNFMYCVIPDDKVGIVIGRGGCTIKDIQGRHNVRIQIPQAADPGSQPPVRTISIQGGANEQLSAKFEIENMVGVGGGYYGGAQYGQQGSYYGDSQNDPYYQSQSAYGQYGQHQQAYSQQEQQLTTESTATNPADIDPTAYYNDFWNYASYYGEAAARQYYTTWSPPEGTPPPEGMVIPQSGPTAAGGDGSQLTEEQQADINRQWAEYYKQQELQQQQGQPLPDENEAPPPPSDSSS